VNLLPTWLIDIACSGYFRLSVYTRGILLAYIRHRLSSCLRFHVFLESGAWHLTSLSTTRHVFLSWSSEPSVESYACTRRRRL